MKKEVARKPESFGDQMDRMASDPQIIAVNAELLRDFEGANGDGLPRSGESEEAWFDRQCAQLALAFPRKRRRSAKSASSRAQPH